MTKLADLLEATIAEAAGNMRRQAEAVVSVIDGQIRDLEVGKADLLEILEGSKRERVARLDAFLALHRQYYEAETRSEELVFEGRLSALDIQINALRALAEKILAGEPVMPLAPQLPVEFSVNTAAITDPPVVNGRATAEDDSALDDAAAAAKESEDGKTKEEGSTGNGSKIHEK